MDDYCGTKNKMEIHWSKKNENFDRLAAFNEEKHIADGTASAGTCTCVRRFSVPSANAVSLI